MASSASPDRSALHRWWREEVIVPIDYEQVVERILDESGWSARYFFMTGMSAGIAVLGLLLSLPAVVIGAMLISPLMSPILGLGFSLALFAALASTFAIIRGRGETIVGVATATATALLPPLAVVGYGITAGNMPVLGGALALFATKFLTIALSATVMACYYGFGDYLSGKQSWTQTVVLALVFGAMGVPLAISLGRIARETVTATQVRWFLNDTFGADARVPQLDIDFDRQPMAVRAVVIVPRKSARDSLALQGDLAKLAVPGLPAGETLPERPVLNQRRGLAIADLLRASGVRVLPAPPDGQAFTPRALMPGGKR